MLNKQTEELEVPTESLETLWEKFEKTGSIKAYLLYLQKVERLEKLVASEALS